jgi:hypothetical protein
VALTAKAGAPLGRRTGGRSCLGAGNCGRGARPALLTGSTRPPGPWFLRRGFAAVWFIIIITGRYPHGLFRFVEGVIRWNVRVTAYTLTLVTDRYAPFRLAP